MIKYFKFVRYRPNTEPKKSNLDNLVYFCDMKLYMIMLGCTLKSRFIEQHDIFFGIADSMESLVPQMKAFWPEATNIHIDVWRKVTVVDNHVIEIVPKNTADNQGRKLFFINLGGYKKDEFDEFHYKIMTVAQTLAEAVKKSKESTFYKHFGYRGAVSHIDDKFGIDVDDLLRVDDMLPLELKNAYDIQIRKFETLLADDAFHIGYVKLNKISKQ